MKPTICNPVNINYRYQAPMRSRESADPAVVLYKDEYYLFGETGPARERLSSSSRFCIHSFPAMREAVKAKISLVSPQYSRK